MGSSGAVVWILVGHLTFGSTTFELVNALECAFSNFEACVREMNRRTVRPGLGYECRRLTVIDKGPQ